MERKRPTRFLEPTMYSSVVVVALRNLVIYGFFLICIVDRRRIFRDQCDSQSRYSWSVSASARLIEIQRSRCRREGHIQTWSINATIILHFYVYGL
jgi:hypothetical protein